MKRAEIVEGETYSNAKGIRRKIIKIWKGENRYLGLNPNHLRYEIVRGSNHTRGDYANGRCNMITVAAFARWAKMRLCRNGPPIREQQAD